MNPNEDKLFFLKPGSLKIAAGIIFFTVSMAPLLAGKMGKAGVYVLQCATFLSLIIYVLSLDSNTRADKAKTPVCSVHYLLAILVLWMLFLAVLGGRPRAALDQILDSACWLAAFSAAYMIAMYVPWGKSLIASAIATGGSISALLAAQEFILAKDPSWRAFGPFFNPGYLSGYLTLTLPITIALYLQARRTLYAVLPLMCALLQVSALLLSGTRYGIATGAIAVLCFLVITFCRRKDNRIDWAKLLVFAILAAAAVYISISPLMERIEHPGSESHSGQFRLYTWKAALNMVFSHPIFGTGPGSFEIVFPQYNIAGYTRNAHQSYLQAAAELGFPGLLLLGLAMIFALASALKRALFTKEGDFLVCASMVAGALGSSARGMLDSDLQVLVLALTFWMAVGASADSENRQKKIPRASVLVLAALLLLTSARLLIGAILISAGDTKFSLGDIESAERIFRSAERWSIKNDFVPLRLGQISVLLGYPDEGVEFINKAIKLEPRRARNYVVLGNIFMRLQQPEKALKAYKSALRRDQKSPGIHLALARAYESAGDNESALAEYKLLLEIEKTPYATVRAIPQMVEPEYAFAHYAVAEELIKQRNKSEALRHLLAVAARLEKRASFGKFILVAKLSGALSEEEDASINELYKSACRQISTLMLENGDNQKSREWAEKAKRGLKTPSSSEEIPTTAILRVSPGQMSK